MTRSHAYFVAFWLVSIAVFWSPLRQLVSLSLGDREYSHLLVIPCISACLLFFVGQEGILWWGRHLACPRPPLWWYPTKPTMLGIPVVLAAAASAFLLSSPFLPIPPAYRLSLAILAVLVAWAAGFLLCYGARATRSAAFPLLFLLLMVPLPAPLMARIVFVLQTASSELVYGLLRLTGTPLFRQGFRFELPGIGIEVAQECSSIHSFWALFITGLLVGHFLLRSFAAKACLSVLTVPVAVFTNAVRIVTIYFLAVHVDMDFMYGNLHRNGGILFSLISLSVLLTFLWMLRKLETRPRPPELSPPLPAAST